jgi:hypothetical protein
MDSELERWERDVTIGLSSSLIDDVRAHPRFSEALHASVTKALDHVATDPVLHSTFRDIGQVVLASLALYLDATGGLTHRRLRDLSEGSGALSSGRATAMLWHLQLIGYVTAQTEHTRGKTRAYIPTERMKAAYRARLMIDLESIALLAPEAGAVTENFDDDMFRVYMAEMGAYMRTLGPRTHPDLKDFDALANRNAGVLLIYVLAQAVHRDGSFPQPGHTQISASAIGRRLRVSRMHVLRLLREAEQAGFIVREGNEGITVTPLLCDRLSLFAALLFTLNGAIVNRTLNALAARRQRITTLSA